MDRIISYIMFALLLSKSAHAYIDPGTGSMIFQVVSAFILTGVFTVKIWFKTLKKIFTKGSKEEATKDDKQENK